jgi:hypothetical protein
MRHVSPRQIQLEEASGIESPTSTIISSFFGLLLVARPRYP